MDAVAEILRLPFTFKTAFVSTWIFGFSDAIPLFFVFTETFAPLAIFKTEFFSILVFPILAVAVSPKFTIIELLSSPLRVIELYFTTPSVETEVFKAPFKFTTLLSGYSELFAPKKNRESSEFSVVPLSKVKILLFAPVVEFSSNLILALILYVSRAELTIFTVPLSNIMEFCPYGSVPRNAIVEK